MYTTGQAAQLLGISRSTVHRRAIAGKIPGAVLDGFRWSIPGDYIESMSRPEERTRAPAADARAVTAAPLPLSQSPAIAWVDAHSSPGIALSRARAAEAYVRAIRIERREQVDRGALYRVETVQSLVDAVAETIHEVCGDSLAVAWSVPHAQVRELEERILAVYREAAAEILAVA